MYSSEHDEYVRNTGPLTNLLGWESQDDLGARAHFLIEPSEQALGADLRRLSELARPGSRGVDMFNAASQGLTYDDFDDPRRVNQTGFSPVQDTDHWGAALNATYRTDWFNVQYIGGYRDLHYTNSLSTSGRNIDFDGDERQQVIRGNLTNPDGPLADEFIAERYYGNYSALIWDATSESRTHELRFTSPDDAERLTWAVGLYKFKEEQGVFLGIPLDYSTDLAYLEFNQGSTIGESESAYADLTFAVTDRLRITAGARYSDESKEREGFNFIAGFNTNGVAMRVGTPGFRMTGLGRTIKNPDADGDGVRNTLNDLILLYRAGVRAFGTNDTLDEFLAGQCVDVSQFQGTCANYPGLGFGFGGATVQFGENSDNYVDWRFRVGYDLTDNNLLYFLVATGNKAPSFNDTIDLDTGPAENLFTPPVGPEKNTMFELGSKNTLDVAGRPLVLNASAYYSKYTDQVFSTVVGIRAARHRSDERCRLPRQRPEHGVQQRHAEPERRRSDQHRRAARRRISARQRLQHRRHAAVAGHGVRGRLDRQRWPPRQPGRRRPAGGPRRQRAAAHAAVDAQPSPRPGLRGCHRHARLDRVGDLQELVLPDRLQWRLGRGRRARGHVGRCRAASPTASAPTCCACATRSTATSIWISASATRTAKATCASRHSPTT